MIQYPPGLFKRSLLIIYSRPISILSAPHQLLVVWEVLENPSFYGPAYLLVGTLRKEWKELVSELLKAVLAS